METIRKNIQQSIGQILTRIKKSPLARDSFWALFGNAVGRGLSLIAAMAIARFLGSNAYGEYGMIKGTLLSIAIFSSFGLGYTATKFIAENNKHGGAQIYAIHKIVQFVTLVSSTSIAIIVIIFSDALATWLKDPSLSTILKWSAIAIIMNAFVTSQNGELGGFRAYRIIALNTIIYGAITFIISIPLAYFYGLEGAIIALIISLFLNCLINEISLIKLLPKQKSKLSIIYVKEILSFSFPIALQESLYSIVSWLGMAILVRLADYSQLGLYSAASQWMAVMLFVPGALRNVALSHFSENSDDPDISKIVFKRLLFVNFVSTFIPFVIISIASRWISSFYGESFVELPSVLNICVFTSVINSMSNVLTQSLISHNKNWYLFFARLFRDFSVLLLTLLFIHLCMPGAIALALGWLIMQTVYLLIIFNKQRLIYKYIK